MAKVCPGVGDITSTHTKSHLPAVNSRRGRIDATQHNTKRQKNKCFLTLFPYCTQYPQATRVHACMHTHTRASVCAHTLNFLIKKLAQPLLGHSTSFLLGQLTGFPAPAHQGLSPLGRRFDHSLLLLAGGTSLTQQHPHKATRGHVGLMQSSHPTETAHVWAYCQPGLPCQSPAPWWKVLFPH